MVNTTANRALTANPIPEQFDLTGATGNGGAGPFFDYALNVLNFGGKASVLFDDTKAGNALYSGGFDVVHLALLRPLGFIRPQDFSAVAMDPFLAQKMNADRLPDPSTVNRALHRLEGQDSRDHLRELNRQVLTPSLLADDSAPYVILDGDSSVEVVFGEHMEGAAKGYNPRSRGRDSYHPLIFSDGVRDLVLGAWLRPGNASDKLYFLTRYRETRVYLASIGRPIRFVRLDRGFRGEDVYAEFESDEVGYTVKAARTKRIDEALDSARFTEVTGKGDVEQIEVTEVRVQLSGWSRQRRVVVVRRRLRDTEQQWLGDWGWRYECIVTNLDWSAEDIWRFYNRRCQAENLIKELKEGYGIDKMSTGSFGANDADLVLKVLSYNLIWAFRHAALPKKWRPFTIRTLRKMLLRIPGVLRTHAGQFYVRLADWFAHQSVFWEIRRRVDALVT